MKFCPKCGSIMLVQYMGKDQILKCLKCGYWERSNQKKEGNKKNIGARKKEGRVLIIDKDVEINILPKTSITCPKCGYHEAYYELRQTRSADEPSTRFYTCVRCRFKWREYE